MNTPKSIKKGFLIRLELFGIYYSNKFQTLINKNSYGQDFIVDVPKYKWNITNQSKVINVIRPLLLKNLKILKEFIKLILQHGFHLKSHLIMGQKILMGFLV